MRIDLNRLRNRGFDVNVSKEEISINPNNDSNNTLDMSSLYSSLRELDFNSDYDREVVMEKVSDLIINEQIKSLLFA